MKSQTLFLHEHVETAVKLLRQWEPARGYYVAFSGGKDSTVIYDLCKRAGVKFDAHYSVTTVDPPELIRHIRTHYPAVTFDRPKQSMFQLIVAHRTPPTRLMRYCCAHLKERGGEGRMVVVGVRAAESGGRSARKELELFNKKIMLRPILRWTDSEVWQYIRDHKLPYCSLYDEGFRRLGCVMCPMGSKKGMERDRKRWPHIAELYFRSFEKMIKARELAGVRKGWEHWETPEDVWNWWTGESKKKATGRHYAKYA